MQVFKLRTYFRFTGFYIMYVTRPTNNNVTPMKYPLYVAVTPKIQNKVLFFYGWFIDDLK